ncbi:hypothetical protein J2T17_004676 [Paenibacillus mucilaginosus]|uniref:hypothetical protein n=1 Tax=Paenibacillus mucilaginosus TaxID=61624 RepID=UPI003D24BD16
MSSQPTATDLRMIKRFILLPLILTEFENDRKSIGLTVEHPEPYDELLQRTMDRVTADLSRVRAYLRQNGIKVFDTEWAGVKISAKYVCRGHTGDLSLMEYLRKADMDVAMRYYFGLDTEKFIRKDLPAHLLTTKPDAVY